MQVEIEKTVGDEEYEQFLKKNTNVTFFHSKKYDHLEMCRGPITVQKMHQQPITVQQKMSRAGRFFFLDFDNLAILDSYHLHNYIQF